MKKRREAFRKKATYTLQIENYEIRPASMASTCSEVMATLICFNQTFVQESGASNSRFI
jgi:hypothetical protein